MTDPLREPRRIAFAGDWHENARWARAAVSYAASEHADVIVHTGDYGYLFRPAFTDAVERALAEVEMPLIFVDGNHENFPLLHAYPVQPSGLRRISDHVWHAPRGFRWTWGRAEFLALGGAYSVDRRFRARNLSWWPEETISAEQAQRVIEDGRVDVLVSHDCPTGVDIPGLDHGGGWIPARELAHAQQHREMLRLVVDVVRPAAIWHGHYHIRYSQVVDLGYGDVVVNGLHMDDAALAANIQVVPLHDINALVEAARG